MSTPSQNTGRSRPPLSCFAQGTSPNLDFTTLAAMLQSTAEALLSVRLAQLDTCPEDTTSEHDKIGESGSYGPDSGEIRNLHFSPLALRQEQELLEEQEVDDFRGLLFNAYTSLVGFTSLMENVEAEAEFDGVVIHILAREFKRTERLLYKMQDAYSTVELVEA